MKCLTSHDKNFKIEQVCVPRCTSERLSANVLTFYKNKGLKVL